jgi:hypothetical protein
MKETRDKHAARLIVIGAALLAGCDENQRLAEVAVESAERQASQNEAVTDLNHQAAEGTRRLAESLARQREELVAMQHEVQNERTELETERRELADERQRDSLLAPVVSSLGSLCIGALPLILCWYLLFGLRNEEPDQEVAEVLTVELLADEPLLLPPITGGAPPLPSPDP